MPGDSRRVNSHVERVGALAAARRRAISCSRSWQLQRGTTTSRHQPINTLLIDQILAQPHWQGKFTLRDYAALTPLIWEHVNPYGRFDLDMNSRLALL